MSKAVTELASIAKGYNRIISKWPKDRLRPTYCITEAFKLYSQENFENPKYLKPAELQDRILLGNAQLQSLNNILNNNSNKKYPVSTKLTKPQADPEYYNKLLQHVNEIVSGKAKRPGNWLFNFLTAK
ncbi:hypothetical protein BB561_003042 [Smittium simulii]|uniref:Uncharacterized protein n=1 Tax=Smittium simulii TaxID=133385 RepID=A0A2T9YN63_9FUNG|nr:hypothetical protein BB561_003042 [Smittium simulii]